MRQRYAAGAQSQTHYSLFTATAGSKGNSPNPIHLLSSEYGTHSRAGLRQTTPTAATVQCTIRSASGEFRSTRRQLGVGCSSPNAPPNECAEPSERMDSFRRGCVSKPRVRGELHLDDAVLDSVGIRAAGWSLVIVIVWASGEGWLALPLLVASVYAVYSFFRYEARIILLDLGLLVATFFVMYAASLLADN